MHDELEPRAEDTMVVGNDLVTIDGEDVSPPSSRIGRGDVERILAIGDGMNESEPQAQSSLRFPGMAAMNLQNMLGSVGLIGTGAKVSRAVRPIPEEVQSTVRFSGRHQDEFEMSADLVVLDTMDAIEDDAMEEAEPVMQEAQGTMKPSYFAQEVEQFSSSATESGERSTPDRYSTPVRGDVYADDEEDEAYDRQPQQELHDGVSLSLPFEGQDQEENEPLFQGIADEQEQDVEEVDDDEFGEEEPEVHSLHASRT